MQRVEKVSTALLWQYYKFLLGIFSVAAFLKNQFIHSLLLSNTAPKPDGNFLFTFSEKNVFFSPSTLILNP